MSRGRSLFTAEGLCFGWPGEPQVFDGLDIALPAGVSWIGGDEGAGKTTLLRLIAGELQPLAGTVQVAGSVFWIDPRRDGCDALTPPQCFDQVAARHSTFDRALLADLVEELGLASHLAKRLDMLSTGSRRKVWLAAALATGASLTLLDQPFAALDKASIGFVTALLQEAADHPARGWVVADYEAPRGVRLAKTVVLPATKP